MTFQPKSNKMKKFTAITLLFIFTGFSASAQLFDVPEDPWSGNLALGLGFPMTDLTEVTYTGYKPNLAVSAGIGLQLRNNLRLRGDLLAGFLNGNNANSYFQAEIFEGNLALEYNLISLLEENTNFKLNLVAGAGAGLLNSNRFDINTRQRIAEVPSPPGSIYSYQVHGLGGVNVMIPIQKSLDLTLGYVQRVVIDQPWIDGLESGEATDMYGMMELGFTVYLRDPRDKSKMEVDPNRYKNLQLKADSLDMMADMRKRNSEKVARLEMSNQEQEVQIAALQAKVDTLQIENEELTETLKEGGQIVIRRGSKPADKKTASGGSTGSTEKSDAGKQSEKSDAASKPTVTKKVMEDVMYRVVIGSLPSREAAERYIARSSLPSDEMFIAYIDDLDTYRVVYKSTTTYALARKYMLEAKSKYADAWIIEF